MNTYRIATLSAVTIAAALASSGALAQSKCGLANGKKATGEPIAIGAVVGKTGPDDFSSSAQAAAAYFKCVNDNGGINGRPIDYIVADDQWNPETAAQVASKLVKDRKVVALAGSTSFVECGANAKMYADEGVMVIAGTGVPRECFNAKNYVPINSGPRISGTIAAMYAAQTYKSKKMVCIIPNIPSLGNWACEGPKEWGKKNGVEVETIAIDPGSADATSVMLQAASKKPDTIIMNVPKGILVPMLAAAEQQNLGKKIHFVSSAPAYSVDVPKAIGPYWNKNFAVNLEFNPLESKGADNLNWQSVMNSHGAKTDPRDTFSQAGYLAARLVTETLLKMDVKKIDRASVTDALRKVSNFRSDILCKPFYVGAGNRHNANNSGPMVVIDGNGFAGASAGCLTADDPELVDVRADEKKLSLN
ncbi:ABC transporter substrate-binding protein [Ramlibacter sp. WS9]|uniref:ABC transporter substrate-binding protein n=1 Tax=Ramlibacter sp. WS9 TaxID=1882741 RepID=UPI0011430763|nr:ABC transporter substrate-binding protein [Ramlibacter sp. WS9]ROZ71292.1 branched-chain amino acid ABC transporter substrate-binding protein [Ramlibacter sp. WS9]